MRLTFNVRATLSAEASSRRTSRLARCSRRSIHSCRRVLSRVDSPTRYRPEWAKALWSRSGSGAPPLAASSSRRVPLRRRASSRRRSRASSTSCRRRSSISRSGSPTTTAPRRPARWSWWRRSCARGATSEADRDDCALLDIVRHLVGERPRDGARRDEWIDGRQHGASVEVGHDDQSSVRCPLQFLSGFSIPTGKVCHA